MKSTRAAKENTQILSIKVGFISFHECGRKDFKLKLSLMLNYENYNAFKGLLPNYIGIGGYIRYTSLTEDRDSKMTLYSIGFGPTLNMNSLLGISDITEIPILYIGAQVGYNEVLSSNDNRSSVALNGIKGFKFQRIIRIDWRPIKSVGFAFGFGNSISGRLNLGITYSF